MFFVFRDSYVLCIYIYTNIMNVLRTGMNMSISRLRIWLWYKSSLMGVCEFMSIFLLSRGKEEIHNEIELIIY